MAKTMQQGCVRVLVLALALVLVCDSIPQSYRGWREREREMWMDMRVANAIALVVWFSVFMRRCIDLARLGI